MEKKKTEKGKKAKSRSLHIALSALILVAAFLLGIGVNWLKLSLNSYIDLTENGLYTPTKAFLKEVERIEDDVKIIFCADPDTLLENQTTRYVYIMARALERRMPNIKVETYNVAEDPTKVQEYRTTSASEINWDQVIVSCEKRYRILSAVSFWSYMESGETPVAFDGEYRLATALLSITAVNRPVAYFTKGHGEKVYDPDDIDAPHNESTYAFYDLLIECGLSVKPLDLEREEIPSDCVLLILNGPTADYKTAGAENGNFQLGTVGPIEKIDRYLDTAGSLMVFKDPSVSLPVLEEYMEEWGIHYVNGETVRDSENAILDGEGIAGSKLIATYPTEERYPIGHSFYSDVGNLVTAPHTVVAGSGRLTCSWGSDQRYVSEGVSEATSPLLLSSPKAQSYNTLGEVTDTKGDYTLASISMRKYQKDAESRFAYVFAAADTSLSDSEYLENRAYGNYDVLFSIVRSISRTDAYASDSLGGLNANTDMYGGKRLTVDSLSASDVTEYDNTLGKRVLVYHGLTNTAKAVWTVLLLVPSLGFLVFGAVYCLRRRYR